jgi:hypothetical protein
MKTMTNADLSGMPLPRALASLTSRGLTGALIVTSTYRQVTFRLEDGRIAAVESSRPADRFGLQLMRAGEIDIIDLHSALVEQHQQRLRAIATDIPSGRLGDILVDIHALDDSALAAALDRHIQFMIDTLDHDVVLSITFTGSRAAVTEPLR